MFSLPGTKCLQSANIQCILSPHEIKQKEWEHYISPKNAYLQKYTINMGASNILYKLSAVTLGKP